MLEKFNYALVPNRFLHCFHPDCPQSGECLRYQVGTFLPKDLRSVLVVSPVYEPTKEGCTYFKTCQPVVYAEGMDRMLYDLPYHKATDIKQRMLAHFGKTYFYRLKRKERQFTPKDQLFVGRLFQNAGIQEKPKFDAYIEEYDW